MFRAAITIYPEQFACGRQFKSQDIGIFFLCLNVASGVDPRRIDCNRTAFRIELLARTRSIKESPMGSSKFPPGPDPKAPGEKKHQKRDTTRDATLLLTS